MLRVVGSQGLRAHPNFTHHVDMPSTTGSRRGPYAKTAERRAAVSQAALEIVLERGHRELTTAAVAERAGLSERTMQYHFPTRDHLLVAALARYDEQNENSRPSVEETTPHTLADVPGYVLHKEWADPHILQLTNSLSAEADNPEHPARDYFRARYSATREIYARMVTEQQRAGLAHPDLDPVSVARQLIAVWSGLQSQWLVDPSFDLADEIEDAYRRLTGETAMETRQALTALASQI
jgi:AcrR family transcriptional regulator